MYAYYHRLNSVDSMYLQHTRSTFIFNGGTIPEHFGHEPSSPEALDEIHPVFTLPFFRQNLHSARKANQHALTPAFPKTTMAPTALPQPFYKSGTVLFPQHNK